MNQDEIKAAVAAQEEYIKRTSSCRGQVGLPHRWHTLPAGYQECKACGVTRTQEDYEQRLAQ